MIFVFSAFILSGQQIIGEFGIGLAAAVLLDACPVIWQSKSNGLRRQRLSVWTPGQLRSWFGGDDRPGASMADWARSGSVMSGSYSLASRLEVTTVEALRWRSVMIS